MTMCPVCRAEFEPGDYPALTGHLARWAAESDSGHVRWLNQNVSILRLDPGELEPKVRRVFDLSGTRLSSWLKDRFITKFYSARPHPFVLALQRPSRTTLLGYAVEHQHFLRQWVRSCAYIVARTDDPDVIRYELDNLTTEYGGFGPDRPSHYELLLRMGESLGMDRARLLSFAPLPGTRRGIDGWDAIAREGHWVAAMAAMHGLELIASRTLVDDGAKLHYFDPEILSTEEIPAAARAFLKEGYEADVGHSEEALGLVERIATAPGVREAVQATFLQSIDLFDDYLMARLERGEQLARAT